MKKIALATTNNQDISKLIKELNHPVVDISSRDYDYLLVQTSKHLEIRYPNQPTLKPFYIDFSHGKLGYRIQHAVGRNELIAKAVGIKKDYRPTIIDATAGLARDGFLLASLGCKLILLERSKILFALVEDGLNRFFLENPQLTAKFSLEFINIDALDFLINAKNKVNIIYLDPMFPHRIKTAKIKKEAQLLQDIIGEDKDIEKLFTVALAKASKRVVVKRPLYAENIITQLKPDVVYSGKSIRFDVYFIK